MTKLYDREFTPPLGLDLSNKDFSTSIVCLTARKLLVLLLLVLRPQDVWLHYRL